VGGFAARAGRATAASAVFFARGRRGAGAMRVGPADVDAASGAAGFDGAPSSRSV
jgi:hypothetical protein